MPPQFLELKLFFLLVTHILLSFVRADANSYGLSQVLTYDAYKAAWYTRQSEGKVHQPLTIATDLDSARAGKLLDFGEFLAGICVPNDRLLIKAAIRKHPNVFKDVYKPYPEALQKIYNDELRGQMKFQGIWNLKDLFSIPLTPLPKYEVPMGRITALLTAAKNSPKALESLEDAKNCLDQIVARRIASNSVGVNAAVKSLQDGEERIPHLHIEYDTVKYGRDTYKIPNISKAIEECHLTGAEKERLLQATRGGPQDKASKTLANHVRAIEVVASAANAVEQVLQEVVVKKNVVSSFQPHGLTRQGLTKKSVVFTRDDIEELRDWMLRI